MNGGRTDTAFSYVILLGSELKNSRQHGNPRYLFEVVLNVPAG